MSVKTRYFAFEPHGHGWNCRVVLETGHYEEDDYVSDRAVVEQEYSIPGGTLEAEIAKWFKHLCTWEDQSMLLSMLPQS